MLTVRLSRFGKKDQPFYRIVVTEKRSKRDGYYVDEIGYYNPLPDSPQIKIDEKKLEKWKNKGAQVSDGMRKLLKYWQHKK